MTAELLNRRALNRATLARQLLLERAPLGPVEAVGHLVGLQAQVPLNPYTGLWSRLAGFEPEALSVAIEDRRLVRLVLMRGTIHLATAADALGLRGLVQPILDRELVNHRDHAPHLAGVDLTPVLAFAASLLAEGPRSNGQLRSALAARFPDLDAAALAYACRNHLALVQVPPRGLWGRSAQVTSTTAEAWLGRPLDDRPSLDDAVLRYLRAYGPSTAADIAAWSGLTGLREVVERMRPGLVMARDERGRELFDVPGAPRPPADAPAPARFLPEYDNALLAHADRDRFGPAAQRAAAFAGPGPHHGPVLHDGELVASWRLERAEAAAVLVVQPGVPLRRVAEGEITAEGLALLGLVAADATERDVRILAAR